MRAVVQLVVKLAVVVPLAACGDSARPLPHAAAETDTAGDEGRGDTGATGGDTGAIGGDTDQGNLLAFAPPALTSPITVDVTNANPSINLDSTQDYRVVITEAIANQNGVVIVGGRNVVLIGGSIESTARGLYLKKWTGTMHVEGIHIKGAQLTEGINADTRTVGAVLQIENVRVETVHGSQDTNHADIIQNWGGPTVYRIDRLTGSTTYQGFMIQPTQFGAETTDLVWRHVNVSQIGDEGYVIYRASGVGSMSLTDVWIDLTTASHMAYPVSHADWAQLHRGQPPGGDFVPEHTVGMGYVSPGYAQ